MADKHVQGYFLKSNEVTKNLWNQFINPDFCIPEIGPEWWAPEFAKQWENCWLWCFYILVQELTIAKTDFN